MESLPRRQQEVLRATVRHYVDTVEPVGSHTLVRRFAFPASPATVRSAMGALEQRGLLTQPHTSAGRIPSQLGYRLYVDQLLPAPGAAALQLNRELAGLSLQWASLDDLLQHLARRLADLTGLLSLISRPQRPRQGLQAVRLVPSSDRLLVFLVQGPALTTSLNLRLPSGSAAELPLLERWTNDQLDKGLAGGIPWERLPAQLGNSGQLLRQALESHTQLVPASGFQGIVAAGLVGLLGQPEFSRSASLLPLVELVENGGQQVLGPDGTVAGLADPGKHGIAATPAGLREAHPRDADSRGVDSRGATSRGAPPPASPPLTGGADPGSAIWIGTEHPHAALGQCAVVQAQYGTADGSLGQVALVGPMRMAYATARSAVQSVASILQRLLS